MNLNLQLTGREYGPFEYLTSDQAISLFGRAVSAPFCDEAHPGYAACFNQRPFSVALRDPELHLDFARLLHAAQSFEFFERITPGIRIITCGRIESIYARGELEFISVSSESRNEGGELLVKGLYTGVVK